MGQYHILVNLTRKEFVNPQSLGLGLKQVEHINEIGRVIYLLTMVPTPRGGGDMLPEVNDNFVFVGSWLGDKIAIVGDYSCDKDLPSFPNFGSIWKECMKNSNPLYGHYHEIPDRKQKSLWRDITVDLSLELEQIFGKQIIPYDHPTLWPDGKPKPEYLVAAFKNKN